MNFLEIRKLNLIIHGIIETDAIEESNYCGPIDYKCPFCLSMIDYEDFGGMDSIDHDEGCAYRLAKEIDESDILDFDDEESNDECENCCDEV